MDTSALAKRYLDEIGYTWVRSWILPRHNHTILISRLTTVEMISLLVRKQYEMALSPIAVLQIRDNFFAHVRRQYNVVEFETRTFVVARRLIFDHQLRTLDAIQLADALLIVRDFGFRLTFVSADTRLLTAAAAEGLPTDNPTAHP